MLEKNLERKLKTAVKFHAGLCIKIYCAEFTGMPDRLVLLPEGKLGWVEVKRPGQSIDKKSRQKLLSIILRKLGFKVFELNAENQIQTILNQILQ